MKQAVSVSITEQSMISCPSSIKKKYFALNTENLLVARTCGQYCTQGIQLVSHVHPGQQWMAVSSLLRPIRRIAMIRIAGRAHTCRIGPKFGLCFRDVHSFILNRQLRTVRIGLELNEMITFIVINQDYFHLNVFRLSQVFFELCHN